MNIGVALALLFILVNIQFGTATPFCRKPLTVISTDFWKAMFPCFVALLLYMVCYNDWKLVNLGSGRIYTDSLIMTLMDYGSVGLFEEVVIRAILIGHMMHYWRNDPRRVSKTVIWSSVIFGVLHIGNILDFFGGIAKIFVPLQADMAAYEASLKQVPQVLLSRIPEETLISIAPLLQLMPFVLSLVAAVTAIYMLRSGKHSQIDMLWEEL